MIVNRAQTSNLEMKMYQKENHRVNNWIYAMILKNKKLKKKSSICMPYKTMRLQATITMIKHRKFYLMMLMSTRMMFLIKDKKFKLKTLTLM